MKSLTLLAIYIASFIICFLILSVPGYLFVGSFEAVIKCTTWQLMYSLFIGWWMAVLPTREYYLKNQQEFDKIFS